MLVEGDLSVDPDGLDRPVQVAVFMKHSFRVSRRTGCINGVSRVMLIRNLISLQGAGVPLPLGPINPVINPFFISRLSIFRVKLSKFLLKFLISIAFIIIPSYTSSYILLNISSPSSKVIPADFACFIISSNLFSILYNVISFNLSVF